MPTSRSAAVRKTDDSAPPCSVTQRDDGILLSLCAFGVAFLGVWGGARLKLDYSAKLFIMTFLLVTFGAQNNSKRSLIPLFLVLSCFPAY